MCAIQKEDVLQSQVQGDLIEQELESRISSELAETMVKV